MRVNADSACGPPVARHLLAKAASSGCASLTPDFCNCSGTIGVFTAMPALAHIAAEPHLSDARLGVDQRSATNQLLSAVLGRSTACNSGAGEPSTASNNAAAAATIENDLSDLMIQAAPTHLDTRPYELTG